MNAGSSGFRKFLMKPYPLNKAGWSLCFSRGSAFASGYSALTGKTLDSIMNVESVKDESPEDLTTIWNEYHFGRGHISAVMGGQLSDLFQQRASASPLFVIPVRRGLGYITLLLQAQMPYLLFTGLNDYRARGSDATPFLTVTHHTEFAQSKGVVLLRGDVVLTSKLSDNEARSALEAAHSFYLNTSRYRLVTTFNEDSRDFEFRDVLRELNSEGVYRLTPGLEAMVTARLVTAASHLASDTLKTVLRTGPGLSHPLAISVQMSILTGFTRLVRDKLRQPGCDKQRARQIVAPGLQQARRCIWQRRPFLATRRTPAGAPSPSFGI